MAELSLRSWTEADADALVECLDGDEEIWRWLDQIPQPYTREDALAYIGSDMGEQSFAIVDAVTGRVLGSIGLRWNESRDVAEVGYWVRKEARGAGVAAAALESVARIAFNGGAERIQLRAAVDNAPSRRVAEKSGFKLEGTLRSARWSPRLQRRVDWAMYSLLPGEL